MKAKLPNLEITSTITPNTVPRKKPLPKKSWRSNWVATLRNSDRFSGDQPLHVEMDTDGRHLIIRGGRDWHGFLFWIAIFGYFAAYMASIFWFIDFLQAPWKSMFQTAGIITWLLLIIAILIHAACRYIPATAFFVFDRDHGTVAFPRFGKRYLVVPFSKVRCLVKEIQNPKSGSKYYETYLFSLVKRKGSKARREPIELLASNTIDGQRTWSVLCAFMDKSKPLPDVHPIRELTDWYRFHNTTIAEYYKEITEFNPNRDLVESYLSDEVDTENMIVSAEVKQRALHRLRKGDQNTKPFYSPFSRKFYIPYRNDPGRVLKSKFLRGFAHFTMAMPMYFIIWGAHYELNDIFVAIVGMALFFGGIYFEVEMIGKPVTAERGMCALNLEQLKQLSWSRDEQGTWRLYDGSNDLALLESLHDIENFKYVQQNYEKIKMEAYNL